MTDSKTPRRFRFPRLFWLRDRYSVDDEFRHHIELREAELRASGLSARDARAEAARQFGDAVDARAYCERMDSGRQVSARWSLVLDELGQDLHSAFRQVSRHPAASGSTITVLALGLALFAAALGVADAYLVRAMPFPDADRIVSVRTAPTAENFPRMPDLRRVDWTEPARAFDGVVTWDLDGFTLMGGERPDYADGAWVSPGYFSLLGIEPAVGRGFDSTEYRGGARVAIISDALWQRRFGGDRRVIGTSVRMFSIDRPAEQEVVTIVGVLPKDAWHINRFTDVLRPLTTPRMFYLARLPSGGTMEAASARMNAAVRPQLSAPDLSWSMSLVRLRDEYVREARPAILALVVGATLTLLIAITNVAGMFALRGARRQGEFAVRAALGAGRGRIARQSFIESLVVTGAAAAIGLTLASALLQVARPVIERRLGVGVPGGESLGIDWRLTLIVAPVAILAALAGAWRVARVHRISLTVSLRPGATAGVRHARVRTMLMGAQVALTFALLVGAGLMVRTAWHITHVPLGFDPRGVYSGHVLLPVSRFSDSTARARTTLAMIDAVGRRPDVAAVAAAWPTPFAGTAPTAVRAERSPTDATNARRTSVSDRYFDVLGISLREGRVFSARDDASAERVVVVGERLAQSLWPSGGAIGARVKLGSADDEPWRTVVGVVADARSSVLSEQDPAVYVPIAQSPRAYFAMIVRWKDAVAGNTTGLRNALASVDESLALSNAESLVSAIERENGRPRALSWMLVAFSVFGLLLAAVGLASSLAHAVAQRRPEFALRLALGASPLTIFAMIVRDAGVLVAAGVGGGLLLSVAVARALASQLNGVSATDPVVYIAIAGVVVVVAFLAAVLPARSAASVDPARTLRAP